MSTHDQLSPSKRDRWSRCPGSVREEAKYPEERSGAAAIDGTHTHTLLEKCLKELMSPNYYIGKTLKDHDGEFVPDAARAERVAFALDKIMEIRISHGSNAQLISERKVDPVYLTGISNLKGTVDVQIVSDDHISIIDYKDGMGVVEANGNKQLEQYAVGVMSELFHVQRDKIKKVTLTIIQPKLREKGMDGIVSHTMTRDEVDALVPKIIEEAKAAMAPDAPLIPGDVQCKYCRHKGACTALTGAAMDAAGISFDTIDEAYQQAAEIDPLTLTDEKIKEILEAAPLIRQMLDGVESEAFRRLNNEGKVISGLKLVRGRGSRGWAYKDDEMEAKLKKMGLPKDVIWKTSLISPAQVEKAIWTKRDGTQKQLSERQLKTIDTEFVTHNDGKLQVVLESDSRPAVTLSVAGMFAPVEADKPVVPEVPDFLLPLPDFLKGN